MNFIEIIFKDYKNLIKNIILFFLIFAVIIFINKPSYKIEISFLKSNEGISFFSLNEDNYEVIGEEKIEKNNNNDFTVYNIQSNYGVLEYHAALDKNINENYILNNIKITDGYLESNLNSEDIFQLIEDNVITLLDIEYSYSKYGINFTPLSDNAHIKFRNDINLYDINGVENNTILISFLVSILLTYLINKYFSFNDSLILIQNIYNNRITLYNLSINDLKSKYNGSIFGVIWAFIQPIATILTFWFVFEIGLRSSSVENVPFILWLMSGLIPWFFFSESWMGITNVYSEYSYLVKKVVFDIDILPIIKIVSSFFVHAFFIVFMLIIFCIYQFYPTINMLMILYYLVCTAFLTVGLGFITASISPFFKDLTPIMNIILQLGMWFTPIMWNISTISESLIWIFKINPMYYIVLGYRSSLLGSAVPSVTITDTVYFWFISTIILLLGITLFKRLKNHFADVL